MGSSVSQYRRHCGVIARVIAEPYEDVRDVKVTDEDGSVPQHDDAARDGSLTRQTTSEIGRTPEENKKLVHLV